MTNTVTLDVLSLWQPHATALVHPNHPKTIETRSRNLHKRGWVLVYATVANIHALPIVGGGWYYEPPEVINRIRGTRRPARLLQPNQPPVPLPHGAIVGAVRIDASVPIETVDTCQGDATVPHIDYVSPAELLSYPGTVETTTGDDISDQMAWGLYTPGRWGWITGARIMFPEPIPTKATNQGWWRTAVPADLLAAAFLP